METEREKEMGRSTVAVRIACAAVLVGYLLPWSRSIMGSITGIELVVKFPGLLYDLLQGPNVSIEIVIAVLVTAVLMTLPLLVNGLVLFAAISGKAPFDVFV